MRACQSCEFWLITDDLNSPARFGVCRRFPPRLEVDECVANGFPTTVNDMYCGEWRADTKEENGSSHNKASMPCGQGY